MINSDVQLQTVQFLVGSPRGIRFGIQQQGAQLWISSTGSLDDQWGNDARQGKDS